MNQIIFVQVRQAGQLFQRQIFLEMIVDIASYQIAFPAGTGSREFVGKGELPLALQAQQNHLQQMTADFFIVLLCVMGFLKDQVETVHQFFPAAVQMEHGVALITGEGLQAVHAKHNVFQRVLGLAQLGVGHICVYDNQVVDGNGKFLLLCAEETVAVCDEKQFCTGVRVETGAPFRGILIPGDIVQPRSSAVGGLICCPGKNMLVAAQNVPPCCAI